METKTCSKCSKTKPITDFFKSGKYPSGKDKIRGDCKTCAAENTAQWRTKNRSDYNNYAAHWRSKNPDKQHATDIKRNYGLAIEAYNELLTLQKNQCKLCCKQHDPTRKRGRLFVDHDHMTGAVRGLLCSKCNSILGYAQENPNILEKAIAYLANSLTRPPKLL